MICSECGSTNLVQDYVTGELTCHDCGLVHSTQFIVARSSTWEKERNSLHNQAVSGLVRLGTTVSRNDLNNLNNRRKYFRLLKINKRQEKNIDRNYRIANHVLYKACEKLKLPANIPSDAAYYYKKANTLLSRNCIKEMALASIYVSCRFKQILINFEDLANTIGVEVKKVRREFLRLAQLLNNKFSLKIPRYTIQTYISFLCNRLHLSMHIEQHAMKMAELVGDGRGRNPKLTAAAIIYMKSSEFGERRTQNKIASVANISEVGLRICKQEIEKS